MYAHHKVDHVFAERTPPRRCFVVCAVPRSGSSLLCEGLCLTGLAGAPTEFFDRRLMTEFSRSWGATDRDSYIRRLLETKTGPNGVFGMKIHVPQLAEAFADRDLCEQFPPLDYFFIQRKDKLRQAISYSMALKTDRWASHQKVHGTAKAHPRFDFQHIARALDEIGAHEREWEDYFSRRSITPVRIFYEDLVAAYTETIRLVLGRLGIANSEHVEIPPPTLERQAGATSEAWFHRFSDLQRYGANLESAPLATKLRWWWRDIVEKRSRMGRGELHDGSGSLDRIHDEGDALVVTGWFLLDDGAADRIELRSLSGDVVAADPVERRDVAAVHPRNSTASRSGFTARLPASAFADSDCYRFTLCASRGEKICFENHVRYVRDRKSLPFVPSAPTALSGFDLIV